MVSVALSPTHHRDMQTSPVVESQHHVVSFALSPTHHRDMQTSPVVESQHHMVSVAHITGTCRHLLLWSLNIIWSPLPLLPYTPAPGTSRQQLTVLPNFFTSHFISCNRATSTKLINCIRSIISLSIGRPTSQGSHCPGRLEPLLRTLAPDVLYALFYNHQKISHFERCAKPLQENIPGKISVMTSDDTMEQSTWA